MAVARTLYCLVGAASAVTSFTEGSALDSGMGNRLHAGGDRPGGGDGRFACRSSRAENSHLSRSPPCCFVGVVPASAPSIHRRGAVATQLFPFVSSLHDGRGDGPGCGSGESPPESTATSSTNYSAESTGWNKRRNHLLRQRLWRMRSQRLWRMRSWGEDGRSYSRCSNRLGFDDGPTDADDEIDCSGDGAVIGPFLTSEGDGKIRTRWSKLRNKKPAVDESSSGATTSFVFIPMPSATNARRKSKAERLVATDVETLRGLYGTNRNRLWGDLDVETARRLYHLLLPRALVRLQEQGLGPDELAPVAFAARSAAKEYVRERCRIPGRLFAVAYDGLRHWRRYGRWSPTGLSWDELWSKYERQIREEAQVCDPTLKLEDMTSRVCLRILRSSCRSNEVVDRLVMGETNDEKAAVEGAEKERNSVGEEVLAIALKLDRELHKLLNQMEKERAENARYFFKLRLLVATKRRWTESISELHQNSQILRNFSWR